MLIRDIIPHPSLAPYVRLFKIIHFVFPNNVKIPIKAYTPRPEHCLQFFPQGKNTVNYNGSTDTIHIKNASFSGQHTIITNRQPENNFLSIQVIFKPGTLQQWLGISAKQLTNTLMEAEDLLGSSIATINEQLYHANNYADMIAILESFLRHQFKNIKSPTHRVNDIFNLMIDEDDRTLDWFMQQAFLSHRQFDRKCYDSTGLAPKDLLKVIRFDKAFRMKNRFPKKDWLSIALHCGYYDYQHLSKVYQLFTGYTPPDFFAIDNKAPERLLGGAET